MKSANTTGTTTAIKNLAFAIALILFLVSPLSRQFAAADRIRGIELWPDKDGKNDYLSYLELVKLLNDNLGDAQQVNIYNNTCHGGALLTQSGQLTMPYFVGVGEKDPRKCIWFGDSTKDQIPPGRLTISGGYSDNYFYSFADYVTKRLQWTDPIATVEALFDVAAASVEADPDLAKHGQKPGSTSGNKADLNLAINGGAKSNHALIFDGYRKDFYDEPGLELYRALVNANYGFKQGAGNSLSFYFNNFVEQDYEGTHIDGSGTLEHFKAAMQNLQTLVKKNPNQELVNIFFDGHGYEKAAAAPRQPGLGDQPKDGYLVSGGTQGCLTFPTDSSFWHDLKIGIVPNDEDLIRVDSPAFVLDVSEASISHPVTIMINNLLLGEFNLSSTSTGGELDAVLSDSTVSQLIAESDGAPSLTVTFELAPGDYFRVATEDDILLDPSYSEGDYGFGIVTTIVGTGSQQTP